MNVQPYNTAALFSKENGLGLGRAGSTKMNHGKDSVDTRAFVLIQCNFSTPRGSNGMIPHTTTIRVRIDSQYPCNQLDTFSKEIINRHPIAILQLSKQRDGDKRAFKSSLRAS